MPQDTIVSDKDTLVEAISNWTRDHWSAHESPLLMSTIGANLQNSGVDYKSFLEGASLLQFLRTQNTRVKVVQHSRQYARVGLVPPNMDYSFEEASESETSNESHASRDAEDLKRSRGAFYSFIREISKLPEEEIEQIHIPMKVIVRLLEGK